MTENNARQADVPRGAAIIPQVAGTAPGLVCPVGNKVVYAVPGVPYEMAEMFERGILPDLRARMAESGRGERCHRQPRAAHLGRQRVRTGRVPAGPHRRARCRR